MNTSYSRVILSYNSINNNVLQNIQTFPISVQTVRTVLIMHSLSLSDLKDLIYSSFDITLSLNIVGVRLRQGEVDVFYPFSIVLLNVHIFHNKTVEIIVFNSSLRFDLQVDHDVISQDSSQSRIDLLPSKIGKHLAICFVLLRTSFSCLCVPHSHDNIGITYCNL